MGDWDLKFIVGDIVIPIAIFVIGFFTGQHVERKASARVKGNNNVVVQNSNVNSKEKKVR